MSINDTMKDNPGMMGDYLLRNRMGKRKINFLVNLPLIKDIYDEYDFIALKENKVKDTLDFIQKENKLSDRKDTRELYLSSIRGNMIILNPNSLPIAAIEWRYGVKGGYCIHTGDTEQLMGYVIGRTPWMEYPDDHIPTNIGKRSRILLASEINVNSDPEWSIAKEEVIVKPMKKQPIIHMIDDLRVIENSYAWRIRG